VNTVDTITAIVVLHSDDPTVSGVIYLSQKYNDGSPVRVYGQVIGLTPGDHALRVHRFGDLANKCGAATGAHFNADWATAHGAPCMDVFVYAHTLYR
jgi:Cu-Zn family superoxide dismutase